MRQCENCNTGFAPKNEQAKYCSTKCKTEAFYKRKITGFPHVEQAVKPTYNERMDEGYISYTTLNMLLTEQEKRHQAEIEKVKSDLKVIEIENKIEQLRKEFQEEEQKEPTIAGFKLADIVQAYSAYQQMQSLKTEVK